jgi:hypothetical protein
VEVIFSRSQSHHKDTTHTTMEGVLDRTTASMKDRCHERQTAQHRATIEPAIRRRGLKDPGADEGEGETDH